MAYGHNPWFPKPFTVRALSNDEIYLLTRYTVSHILCVLSNILSLELVRIQGDYSGNTQRSSFCVHRYLLCTYLTHNNCSVNIQAVAVAYRGVVEEGREQNRISQATFGSSIWTAYKSPKRPRHPFGRNRMCSFHCTDGVTERLKSDITNRR